MCCVFVCEQRTGMDSSDVSAIVNRVLPQMDEVDRAAIQSVAPQLMALAGMKGFVVDLDDGYISITGEDRANVVRTKLCYFRENKHYQTRVVKTVSHIASRHLHP